MNKITFTLAGFALAASLSVVPAFAQVQPPPVTPAGNLFSPPGSFTFTGFGTSSFAATSGSVSFNPVGSTAASTASFSLTGTLVSGFIYRVTSFVFTQPGFSALTEVNPLQFVVLGLPTGGVAVSSIGAASDGTTFNLVSPVPEASTTISFGLLALGLGGLVVASKRKKMTA